MSEGQINRGIRDGVGTIEFHHPNKNCLPRRLLEEMAATIHAFASEKRVQVVVVRSRGNGAFCTGVLCEELAQVDSVEKGTEFFMGFARLILAIKNCPKFVVVRVHGKVMGGGVGLVAVSDYALAVESASVKFSELRRGIGAFVIAPCLERRLGLSAFQDPALCSGWQDAAWAKAHGFYSEVFATVPQLDDALSRLTVRLARGDLAAMARMKKIFWEGTDEWETLLEERARLSGELFASEFTARKLNPGEQDKI